MSVRTKILAMAGFACISGVSFAQSDPLHPQGMTSDQIGYIYYNMATGEMIRTGPRAQRDINNPVWINEAYDQCGCGEWKFQPLRNSGTGENTWWLDWGDIRNNTVIDTMTLIYATDVFDAEDDGVDGFEYDITFFDGVDTAEIEAGPTPYLVYTITGIPGSASGLAGWIITIDVSGGGEFEIGDTDGIDDSGNGNNSGGLGADVDGDGLADFAYGYNFRHPAGIDSGVSGPALAGPDPRATGDVDMAALFEHQDWNIFDGFFNFGGHDCSPGCGFAWTPWASLYLGLYGPVVDDFCTVDLNNDGLLDFFDVQLFLNLFVSQQPEADWNEDGVWDFFDVQLYLQWFTFGCP
jgi:hypothetical protein